MIQLPPYVQGAELPSVAFDWEDSQGDLIAFGSVAHTFQIKIGRPGQTALLSKTTGITGADTSPNITIDWAVSGELNTLATGTHHADLIATRTSDGKQRVLRFMLPVIPAVT